MAILSRPRWEPPPDKEIWLYHLVSWRNLAAILAQGGLCCRTQLDARESEVVSAAHSNIVERRAAQLVEVGPGGTLSDYVPFYFAPHSPMLCAIAHNRLKNQQVKQTEMVHLGFRLSDIKAAGLEWIFSDGHAAVVLSRFWENQNDFNRIDWPLMKAAFWNNTDDDSDRTRRRQAEFLIHQFVPWELVGGIGVQTEDTFRYVEDALQSSAHIPRVRVRTEWYF